MVISITNHSTFDELDFFIMRTIMRDKNIGTYNLAKKYQWNDLPNLFITKRNRTHFFNKKTSIINYRLSRLSKEGLAIIEGQGDGKPRIVKLITNKIIYKEKYRFPDRVKEALLILNKENKWDIFQL